MMRMDDMVETEDSRWGWWDRERWVSSSCGVALIQRDWAIDSSDEERKWELVELRSMPIFGSRTKCLYWRWVTVVGPPWRLTQHRPISFFLASLRR